MNINNNENRFSNFNPWGMHKKTFEILFEKKPNFDLSDEEAVKEQILKERVMAIIEIYTRLRKKEYCNNAIFKNYIRKNLKCEFPEIVWNEEKFEYEFFFENKKYTFLMLSQVLNVPALKTNKRYNTCHFHSLNLGAIFPGAKVLTGWVSLLQDRYLHSVILLENGRIIDFTKNVIMQLKEYISLTNFTVETILSSEESMEIITKMNRGGFEFKSLSVFGRELLKDFAKRNPSFSKEDTESLETIREIRNSIFANEDR